MPACQHPAPTPILQAQPDNRTGGFPPSLLEGVRYAVCGLGRNGLAVVERLLSLGAQIYAWDDNHPDRTDALPPDLTNAPQLHYGRLTDLPDEEFRQIKALILSPGIAHKPPYAHPAAIKAQKAGIPVLSDAELLWLIVRQSGSRARFVSVTGTNGKSTTTTLLAHIMEKAGLPVAAGGNLGTAALALPRLEDRGVYVIEMSSYMLERLQDYHAHIAIMLNLTPDHLERHGDMAGYFEAKKHVFDHMGPGDLAILGEAAPWATELAAELASHSIPVEMLKITAPCSPDEAPALPGLHNAQNIEACRAASHHLGIKEAVISQAIREFPGLEHRLQQVARIGDIVFINDSKATNAEATAHALAAYDQILWIAGGTAKTGGIEPLTALFGHLAHSFLIGRDATVLAQCLADNGQEFTLCETLENAVSAAFKMAQLRGLTHILLSPSCASFDQFRNFEERGACFTRLAQDLAGIQARPGCS